MIYIFCDLDGVLCDFERHVTEYLGFDIETFSRNKQFKTIANMPIEWWATMPWLEDGKELWQFLINNFKNLHILSTPSTDREEKSRKGKMIWLKNEGIIDQIGIDNCIITSEKHKYVKEDGISILIDDRIKKIEQWRNAGGIGILHTNTKDTIDQLKYYE